MRIRSFVFLSSSLLLSGSLLAQSSSSPYVFSEAQFSTGPTSYSVAAGDFNRDGKLDLAVANADSTNGNSVSVLLGNSDGTFQPKNDYPVGAAPYAVITGDVNRDGKLDLLLADPNANSISILLGNGDGTFQPASAFAVGQRPRAVVVGDFNRDGKPDLVVTNQTDNTISVLLGKGDGTFQPQLTIAVGTISPASVVAADFNKDGKLDLAVAGSGGAVTLQGNGDGTFQTYIFQPAIVPGCFAPEGPVSVVAADFDGDGRNDLAIAVSSGGYCGDSVSVLLGNGDGSFLTSSNYPCARFAFSMIAADLNNDGKPDLVIGESYPDPQPLSILINNGNGTFETQANYPLAPQPLSIAAGDFNADGAVDLAAVTPGNNSVTVLLGTGDGRFQPHTDYALSGHRGRRLQCRRYLGFGDRQL